MTANDVLRLTIELRSLSFLVYGENQQAKSGSALAATLAVNLVCFLISGLSPAHLDDLTLVLPSLFFFWNTVYQGGMRPL